MNPAVLPRYAIASLLTCIHQHPLKYIIPRPGKEPLITF